MYQQKEVPSMERHMGNYKELIYECVCMCVGSNFSPKRGGIYVVNVLAMLILNITIQQEGHCKPNASFKVDFHCLFKSLKKRENLSSYHDLIEHKISENIPCQQSNYV